MTDGMHQMPLVSDYGMLSDEKGGGYWGDENLPIDFADPTRNY